MSDNTIPNLKPPQELLDSLSRASEQVAATGELIAALKKGGFDVTKLEAAHDAIKGWAKTYSDTIGKMIK